MSVATPAPADRRRSPLRIGRVAFEVPVLQAPMSALTNLPLRTLAEEHACSLTYTEFLPAAGLSKGNPKVLAKLTASRDGRPFGVQIYGRCPRQMHRAAAQAASTGAAIVDINMGCPAKKVTRGACGSALMREPALAVALVRAVVAGVDGAADVTVKMRAGWDAQDKNAPELARMVVDAGAVAVTVHGRTRMQRFSGEVDRELIARVKQAVQVPVIANGDVVDVPSLWRMLDETGADGVMIGRAAMGNPWIFEQMRAWFDGLAAPPPPTRRARVETFLRHLELYLDQAEPRRAVREMRKFARVYLGVLPDGPELCRRIYHTEELDRVVEILHEAREQPL